MDAALTTEVLTKTQKEQKLEFPIPTITFPTTDLDNQTFNMTRGGGIRVDI